MDLEPRTTNAPTATPPMHGRAGLSRTNPAWMITCPIGLPSTPTKLLGTSKPFHSRKKSCSGPTHGGKEVDMGGGPHARGCPERVTTRVGQGTANPRLRDAIRHSRTSTGGAAASRTVPLDRPLAVDSSVVDVGTDRPLARPPPEHAPTSTTRRNAATDTLVTRTDWPNDARGVTGVDHTRTDVSDSRTPHGRGRPWRRRGLRTRPLASLLPRTQRPHSPLHHALSAFLADSLV